MFLALITLLLVTLANTVPVQPVDHDFFGKYMAATIALTTLGTFFGIQIGKKRVSVSFEEQFVTRREFEKFETAMAVNNAELKGLFQQTMQAVGAQSDKMMQAIGTQNDTLSKKIENLSSRTASAMKEDKSAHQLARMRIHQNVNRLSEVTATLVAKVSMSEDIRDLAAAIREDVKREMESDNGK